MKFGKYAQCNMFSFGYFPGVLVLIADVSEPSLGSIFMGRWKMEPIEGSETSAIKTKTPGNYPKENILRIEHGESLKSRHILSELYSISLA